MLASHSCILSLLDVGFDVEIPGEQNGILISEDFLFLIVVMQSFGVVLKIIDVLKLNK